MAIKGQTDDKVTLTDLRYDIIEDYLDLSHYVCLRADHRPDGKYQRLFDALQAQRQPSIALIRRRKAWKKRKENQKKKSRQIKIRLTLFHYVPLPKTILALMLLIRPY